MWALRCHRCDHALTRLPAHKVYRPFVTPAPGTRTEGRGTRDEVGGTRDQVRSIRNTRRVSRFTFHASCVPSTSLYPTPRTVWMERSLPVRRSRRWATWTSTV